MSYWVHKTSEIAPQAMKSTRNAKDVLDEEQTQSGFRSTQGKTQGKDGGYDPGPGGGGGGSGKKTFEVRHTTSEEEDYDDPDEVKSDDECYPDFDAWLSQARKENRAENARLNALATGRPGARVLHRRKNGKIVERDQNGNENRTQQNAEGDAKGTWEQKRRDDANRAAANKANKAAQAAQDRKDNADWGGRGTQNPYYVDLGIYM